MLLAQVYYVSPLATAILAIVAGVLILIFPRILNYVVGIYLILVGILALIPHMR